MTPDGRPVFITGSGRSGTTLVYRALCCDHQFGWISLLSDRVPGVPALAALSRFYHWAPAGLRSRSPIRFLGPDAEGHGMFDHLDLPNPGQAWSDLDHQLLAGRIDNLMATTLELQGKARFANKNTLHCARLGLLHHLVPDANFVLVQRDPRAVVASLLRVRWWPDLELWWTNTTPRRFEATGGDPTTLAAEHVYRQMMAMRDDATIIPAEQQILIRYEDLLTDPIGTARAIFETIDRPLTQDVIDRIEAIDIRPEYSSTWKTELTGSQIETIELQFGSELATFGYQPSLDR